MRVNTINAYNKSQTGKKDKISFGCYWCKPCDFCNKIAAKIGKSRFYVSDEIDNTVLTNMAKAKGGLGKPISIRVLYRKEFVAEHLRIAKEMFDAL